VSGPPVAAASPVGPPGRRAGLVDVLASWAAARVAVLGAYALSGYLRVPDRQGLLSWDAFYYLFIAEHGYPVGSPEVTRFFPLVPLLARAVAVLPGVSAGVALLLVANGGALVFALLLYRLARDEGIDDEAARRGVWLLTLAPPAFVLVMGYAESVYGCLAVAFLWALRRRAWLPAAAAGLLAGTSRPLAVVLVAAAAVEAARGVRSAGAAEVARRLLAVVAPAAGTGAFLAYTGARTGSPLLPFTVQEQGRFRGTVVGNPLSITYHNAAVALHGLSAGAGAHVVWLVVYLGLLVVVARTLPAGYTVLAALSLALAATSGALNSLERYAWSAFPFTLALAGLLRRPWAFRLVLTAFTAGLLGYALLAFAKRYVP
jgi:Mannosyltransferase (PIG-V)